MRAALCFSGRVRTPLEPVVLVATLALIPVLIVESDAKSETWQHVAAVANWVIWAVFAVELVAILIVASRGKALLVESARLADLLAADRTVGRRRWHE